MGHSLESPKPAEGIDNGTKNKNSTGSSSKCPSPNGGMIEIVRSKTNRKKSRVTRSQINDFHANTNPLVADDEEEDEGAANPGRRNRYHVCRHCNRAFSSGRALGGHIRIHGASFKGARAAVAAVATDSSNNSSSKSLFKGAEVDGSEDEDEDEEEEEEEEEDSSASSHHEQELSNGCSPKMVSLYTLRNNPKRSSILMDPEFSLELMGGGGGAKRNCWQESNSGIFPYSESGSEHKGLVAPQFGSWSVTKNRSSREPKRQRQRPRHGKEVAADDRDTANLLVMLAGRANGERESTEESVYDSKPLLFSNLESQGSIEDSGSEEEARIVHKKKRRRPRNEPEGGEVGKENEFDVGKYIHRCNTCKKVFNSHQALGGHRASHRKVKGCFAAQGEGEGEGEAEGEGSLMMESEAPREEEGGGTATATATMTMTMSHLTQEESPEQQQQQQESFSQKLSRPHQCSICQRVFLSGQALGGHKRCHWMGDRVTETATSVISKQESGGRVRNWKGEELLDLNQPPPMDEDSLRAAFGM